MRNSFLALLWRTVMWLLLYFALCHILYLTKLYWGANGQTNREVRCQQWLALGDWKFLSKNHRERTACPNEEAFLSFKELTKKAHFCPVTSKAIEMLFFAHCKWIKAIYFIHLQQWTKCEHTFSKWKYILHRNKAFHRNTPNHIAEQLHKSVKSTKQHKIPVRTLLSCF